MGIILTLGFLLRLFTIFAFKNINNYDLQSYFLVGKLTSQGVNIYPNIAKLYHPYLPFFLYIEALAYNIGKSQETVSIIIKLINTLFDLGNIYLIFLISKNLKKTLLYAINPVLILTFSLHGQFDAIPIFFLLLAIYYLRQNRELLSMINYSLAILIKTWPLIFICAVFKYLKDKKKIFIIIFLPIFFTIFYLIVFRSLFLYILRTILNYQGVWGVWGLSIFFQNLRFSYQKIITITFLLIFFLISFSLKKKNIIDKIYFLLVFFIIFSPTFSIQYFSWFMPFLILKKPKNYNVIIVLITFYLIFNYLLWAYKFELIYFNIITLTVWFLILKIYYAYILKKIN
ncbi:MAG: hypothetical protein Fur009_4710 [Candidatus Microgenomates bacterium]